MNRTAIFLTVALGLSGLAEIPSAAAQTSAAVRRPTAQLPAPVGPPVGCPDGWMPRPPELNQALGPCVPATITSKPPTQPGGGHDTGPIQSNAPVKCPKGTKPRPPGLNPALGPCMPATLASDVPPQPGGGHDTGPIQNVQAHPRGQPDLALIASFQLGNVAIPWGTSVVVPADQAAFKRGGLCGFRYKYVTRNQGPVGAIATAGRIMRDAQNGPVLAANGLPALAPGAVAASGGHLSLKPGTWMLYVHTDAPLLVAESDEANNLRRVRVTVEGRCD